MSAVNFSGHFVSLLWPKRLERSTTSQLNAGAQMHPKLRLWLYIMTITPTLCGMLITILSLVSIVSKRPFLTFSCWLKVAQHLSVLGQQNLIWGQQQTPENTINSIAYLRPWMDRHMWVTFDQRQFILFNSLRRQSLVSHLFILSVVMTIIYSSIFL